MTSGQWDLDALEALEREALKVFDVLELPEQIRANQQNPTTTVSIPTGTLGRDNCNTQLTSGCHQQIHYGGGLPPILTIPQQTSFMPPQQRNVGFDIGPHLNSSSQPSSTTDNLMIDLELEDHIKHCSCTCNHMGYGNFMDYQTSCFGGLPDVTESSNRRHSHHHDTIHGLDTTCSGITKSENIVIGCAEGLLNTKTLQRLSSAVVQPSTGNNIDLDMPYGSSDSTNGQKIGKRQKQSKKKRKNAAEQAPTVTTDTQMGDSGYTENTNIDEADNDHQSIEHKPKRVSPVKRKKCCFMTCTIIFVLTSCTIVGSLIMQLFYDTELEPNGPLSNTAFYGVSHKLYEKHMTIIRRVLHETPLIDGHNNLPWNIRKFAQNRLDLIDLTKPLEPNKLSSTAIWSQTDLIRMKQGLVGAQFWSAFVPCETKNLDAVQLALEQIDLIQRFADAYPQHLALVESSHDILTTHRSGLIASLIGVEGGHAIGSSLGVLRTMYALGVRYLTLTHCDTPWAGSYESPERGLTAFGRKVIQEMNRLGMMIDLSLSSEATARDVLKETRAPVIFSHSAARALCNSSQNIGDDILREIADNGGIVMVSFYTLYIACGRESSDIKDVVAHINYIRHIAGVQHVGIGAGFDELDHPPHGLEDVSKYPNLFVALLEDPIWTEHDLALLAGENFLRVLRSVEDVRDYRRTAEVPPVEMLPPPQPQTPCTRMPS